MKGIRNNIKSLPSTTPPIGIYTLNPIMIANMPPYISLNRGAEIWYSALHLGHLNRKRFGCFHIIRSVIEVLQFSHVIIVYQSPSSTHRFLRVAIDWVNGFLIETILRLAHEDANWRKLNKAQGIRRHSKHKLWCGKQSWINVRRRRQPGGMIPKPNHLI